jgi:hypothetical protein
MGAIKILRPFKIAIQKLSSRDFALKKIHKVCSKTMDDIFFKNW